MMADVQVAFFLLRTPTCSCDWWTMNLKRRLGTGFETVKTLLRWGSIE